MTNTAPAAVDDSMEAVGVQRSWWHRHLESEERQRVMAELAIKRSEHWGFRFTTMLTLSVVVAVMGLSANSAAVVIGAMLLAPLMQPVLATAACIAMALFKKSLQAFGHVVLATVWAIALSYVLAALFVRGDLPTEVTSRTAPDIRDLVVALGAGTAGAYATVRKDASASLPGVAVAVALVPPLGAVGISLEAGNITFASGAFLLYATNLAAIVLAGAVVFVVTGFVPPKRLATTFRRSFTVAAVVAAVVVAIAVPLYRASTSAVEASERQLSAAFAVEQWLGENKPTRSPEVTFDGNRILVVVRSFLDPIDGGPLVEALQGRFGADKLVSIEWERVQGASLPTTSAPVTAVVTDEERLLEDVTALVDAWLGEDAPASGRSRDALTLADGVVSIDASGVGEAPSVASLIGTLDEALDVTLEVQLTWLQRQQVPNGAPVPTPDDVIGDEIARTAQTWAAANGVAVTTTSFDGKNATIEVVGSEPPDATALVRDVSDLIGSDAVTVLFVERIDITTTSTTTTTTTSTTTTSTTVPATTVPVPTTVGG